MLMTNEIPELQAIDRVQLNHNFLQSKFVCNWNFVFLHNLKASKLDRLLKLQKYCARVTMNFNWSTKSEHWFIQLQYLPLHRRIEHKTSCMRFKVMKEDALSYHTEFLWSIRSVKYHATRQSSSGNLLIDRSKKNYLQKMFRYCEAGVWNTYIHT